jgi:hypothetical protein
MTYQFRSLLDPDVADRSLVSMIKIDEPAEYDAAPARNLESVSVLQDRELFENFAEAKRPTGSPLYVAVLRNVLVTPQAAIATESGAVLIESCYPYRTEDAPGMFDQSFREKAGEIELLIKGLRVIDEPVFYLREHGETGYFHWIHSVLPRLMMREHIDPGHKFKLLTRVREDFQRSSFDLLGIHGDQIVDAPDRETVFCRLMYYPAPLVMRGNFWRRPPQIMSFFDQLREKVAGREVTDGPLIYIGRGDAPVRRLVNEDEVVRALAPLGFRKVLLTGMPFADQIALFGQARAIVAPHGAGLANIAFCRPGATVIEIVSPDRLWPTYRAIAARRGLDYGFALGDQSDPSLERGDFRLDTNKLTALLETQLSAKAA